MAFPIIISNFEALSKILQMKNRTGPWGRALKFELNWECITLRYKENDTLALRSFW